MTRAKTTTRRRFRAPDSETRKSLGLSRGNGAYYEQLVAHRKDPDQVPEPAADDVEVVETWAIQGGQKVKIRVYADQLAEYEEVLAEWEAAQSEEDES